MVQTIPVTESFSILSNSAPLSSRSYFPMCFSVSILLDSIENLKVY